MRVEAWGPELDAIASMLNMELSEKERLLDWTLDHAQRISRMIRLSGTGR